MNNKFEINNSQTYDVLVLINGRKLEFRVRGWKVVSVLLWLDRLPLDQDSIDEFQVLVDGTMVYLDAGEVLKV